jgi:glycosyltransferase involved in cell wall biosynthesis
MNHRLPLSVLIPVKNDEENLRQSLESLRGKVGEIVVVDSQSTDGTQALCEDHGVSLLQFRWNGSFPKKRNWALMNHEFKFDWILLLDADERPKDDFFEEVRCALSSPECDTYWLVFQNFFMGKKIRGDDFRKIGLIQKGKVLYEKIKEEHWSTLDMEIHEHPIPYGRVGVIKTAIPHHDHRGLSSYMHKHLEYAEWEAHKYIHGLGDEAQLSFRQRVKYQLLDSWFLGPIFFVYLYFFRRGFLDGQEGLTFGIQKWVYFWNIKSKINNLRKQKSPKANSAL